MSSPFLAVTVDALDVLVGGAIAALVGAVIAFVIAMKAGDEPKKSADVWLAIGNACLTGGAVALVVVLLQHELQSETDRTNAENAFKNQVLLSADLTGFDPPPHDRNAFDSKTRTCRPLDTPEASGAPDGVSIDSFANWYFGGKLLVNAHLDGFDMAGARFRDSVLRGATLTCAKLAGADFKRADLTGSDLTQADLGGADLRGAALDGRIWNVANWSGAIVDASTCWPEAMVAKLGSLNLDDRPLDPPGDRDYDPAWGHVCSGRTLVRASKHKELDYVPTAAGEEDRHERESRDAELQLLVEMRDLFAEFARQEAAPEVATAGPTETVAPTAGAAAATPTPSPVP